MTNQNQQSQGTTLVSDYEPKSRQRRSLQDIEAFIFDVFGTVVDWRTSVERELKELGQKHDIEPNTVNWSKFAQEWRTGYVEGTRRIALEGGTGPTNVDIMHRQILDNLLTKPEWSKYGSSWTEEEKTDLNLVWHRLEGWPDAVNALNELKKKKIIVPLSNGNMRLLIDMAKHAKLPWDAIFSTELFDTFKPNPKTYLETIRHLSLTPDKCAMVAAHMFDMRGTGSLGITTVYIPRLNEEMDTSVDMMDEEKVKGMIESGEVDYVLKDFLEIVKRI